MDFIVLLKYSFITLKTKVKITSAFSRMSRMVRKLNEGKVMCKKNLYFMHKAQDNLQVWIHTEQR